MSLIWKIRGLVQHFDYDKYWKMRNYIQNDGSNKFKLYRYAYKIKKMDAFANASTGIKIGEGSVFFETPPRLPHGLYGIIVAPGSYIGKNVRICHQVTIGTDFKSLKNVPTIGDNVEIYPGAKIIGKVRIGNNAKIGPNTVIYTDVPDDAVVVVGEQRIVIK